MQNTRTWSQLMVRSLLAALVTLAFVSAAAFAQDSDSSSSGTATPKRHRRKQQAPTQTTDQQAPAAKPADTDDRSGAVAGEPDSDGCGLGWQVSDKKTIMGSITRGSTNSVVPPSFGMTSGTLGCRKTPFSKRDQVGVTYAASNYDALRIEMAQGRGETLDGFARTLGCTDTAAFGQVVQSHYSDLAPAAGNAVGLFQRVKAQVHSDPALVRACRVETAS